jgi:hypothetical protein
MDVDTTVGIYCPLCFQPMEIYDDECGYACYCNRHHRNENNELVNVGCWHKIPDWYLEKIKK